MQNEFNFNQLSNVAEISVTYSHKVRPNSRPAIKCSDDSYELLQKLWTDIDHRESFKIILLNRSNRVLGISLISIGGVSWTVADPKIIFQTALKANAASIIAAHNHPSGNTQPSQADIVLTKRLKEAGQFLEIPLLDHIILVNDEVQKYFSFADEGLI